MDRNGMQKNGMKSNGMDGELYRLLAAMAASGRCPVSEGTPEQARAQLAARVHEPGRPLYGIDDVVVPTEGGQVPVRVYLAGPGPAGTVVYCHGGGWVIGSVDGFDTVARDLAFHSGARVVSVDYSLAPEHPFPAALHEVTAAVAWAAGRFADGPLAVAGDSAGANLVTVAARRMPERVCAQLLYYPVTDSDLTRPSYGEVPPVPTLLSAAEMAWFWDHYAPDPALRTDPDLAPLRAEDLAGLPPSLIMLAGYDPLRDEGTAYAEALRAAGVPVELTVFESLCHGFLGLAGTVGAAGEALRQGAVALRRRLLAAAGGDSALADPVAVEGR